MSDFSILLQERQCLMLLRVLVAAPTYTSEAASLCTQVSAMGPPLARVACEALLRDMAGSAVPARTHPLVTLEEIPGADGWIVRLTPHGADVARGHAAARGVASPSVGEQLLDSSLALGAARLKHGA